MITVSLQSFVIIPNIEFAIVSKFFPFHFTSYTINIKKFMLHTKVKDSLKFHLFE